MKKHVTESEKVQKFKANIDEAKRLRMFLEREDLSTYDLAEIIEKPQPTVSKYLTGDLKIPIAVVKTLHLKLRLNYNWFFHGVGTLKVKTDEEKKIIHNLLDIEAGVGGLIAKVENMDNFIKKMARDLYAHLNGQDVSSD